MEVYKYISGFLLACLLVLGGFYFFNSHKLSNVNDQLNTQLMAANLEIGKAHTQFGDAEKYSKELEGKLAEQIKANDELLTQYGTLKAKFDASGGKSSKPIVVSGPTIEVPKELNLDVNSLYLSVSSNDLKLVGKSLSDKYDDERLHAEYVLNTEPNLHFDFKYDLRLSLAGQIVQTISPTGAVNNYINLWEIGSRKKFEIISYEMTVTDQRESHFMPWAPHVDLGFLGGYNKGLQLGASVGFSFMGYGKTKNDLDWRFIRLGVNLANKNVGLDLEPVSWNLSQIIPFVSNLWISPYASWSFPYGFGAGGMLTLVL